MPSKVWPDQVVCGNAAGQWREPCKTRAEVADAQRQCHQVDGQEQRVRGQAGSEKRQAYANADPDSESCARSSQPPGAIQNSECDVQLRMGANARALLGTDGFDAFPMATLQHVDRSPGSM